MYAKNYIPTVEKERKKTVKIDSKSFHSSRTKKAKEGGCCK